MTVTKREPTLYVNDDGVLYCNKRECKCTDDGRIEFPGRRLTIGELIEAIFKHWHENEKG